ncbi:hypothetical protein [Epiphyas postvittana nucleopolyhedrovirus]|uniref:Uncharacterized protein n=1 Tax=Epiphyas postvittana nucleopolyhedrovirus TaxID=70600 RepID=Q91GM0_NPVEP|nr:hypothetical protein [Epiphyas postvittana nucleopolyhedrovirus]AAK85594.1 unknown [Epiphyas postvittana nucleopolyhedrovirus]
MVCSRALLRAIKQHDYAHVINLALKTRANREYLLGCQDENFWNELSRNCYNRDRFLTAFSDKINWHEVSAHPITIATAKTFVKRLEWSVVSQQTLLKQQFIYELGEHLNLQLVSKNYNNLTLAIQQKYAAVLNWKCIVFSHNMLPEWFENPIAEYIDFDSVSKHKHLNRYYINTPHCINKINLSVYMQQPNKINDLLIIYCLREGRVKELKAASALISWANHMLVFDQYPALVNTLCTDWITVPTWNANSAPPAYYFRHLLVPNTFENDFVNTTYWDKFIEYATNTQNVASAAFALMLFDNFKTRVDWNILQLSDRFVNLPVLYRTNEPLVALDAARNDEKVWRAYSVFINGHGAQNMNNIIPMNMNVRDAYYTMTLVQPCASQQEHDKERVCERVMAHNGGEDALLNWNLLSATQPVCCFNLRHLQNVNTHTYRRDNPHFVQDVYDKMVAAQMNINDFL